MIKEEQEGARTKSVNKYNNSEKGKATRKKYSEIEKGKETRRRMGRRLNKTTKRKESKKVYRQSDKGKKSNRETDKRYFKTEKGKEARRKMNSKRRNLGFISLNKQLEGTVAHHINIEHVIYIPEEAHRSINHNVWSGEGMGGINEFAFRFLGERGVLN